MCDNNDKLFEKYFTSAEACRILRVDKRTMSNWRKARYKGLTWVKIGKYILYPKIEFRNWLDEHTEIN